MKQILAKMACSNADLDDYGNEQIRAYPVTDDCPENKTFSEATPGGELQLMISNKAAQGFFVPGAEYLLTIEKVEPEAS